ncbi:MAG: AEC family transporter, partial [Burkholderiales bacterium]|nr:AEC family transporter [Burkholderiales bacterium]
LRLQGMRREIALVAAGKLLLHPLAVLGGLLLLQPAVPALRSAGIVYASVPMLSIYPVLAQKYGYEGLCAAALLVTTVLSFVTISGWIWVLHAGLGWAG